MRWTWPIVMRSEVGQKEFKAQGLCCLGSAGNRHSQKLEPPGKGEEGLSYPHPSLPPEEWKKHPLQPWAKLEGKTASWEVVITCQVSHGFVASINTACVIIHNLNCKFNFKWFFNYLNDSQYSQEPVRSKCGYFLEESTFIWGFRNCHKLKKEKVYHIIKNNYTQKKIHKSNNTSRKNRQHKDTYKNLSYSWSKYEKERVL